MGDYGFTSGGRQPKPTEVRARQSRHNPPDNEVPGLVPFAATLLQSTEVVVALLSVHAYSTGLTLELAARLRTAEQSEAGFLGDELRGGGPRGRSATALLVGVGYPDGRKASNIGSGRFASFDASSEVPTLSPGGGGGSHVSQTFRYWLSPRPGTGDLLIVAAWPARDLPETHTVIPADLLAAGISRIVEAWPWQPPPEPNQPAPTPPPDLPAGSWFSQP